MELHRMCLSSPVRPPRRRWRSPRSWASLTLAIAAGLALAGCVRASGKEAPGAVRPTPPTTFGPVRAVQLVAATRGWALTPKKLAWTDDSGTSWRDITPPQARAAGVRGAFFLDGSHGWVVASSGDVAAGAVTLGAFRTADGGRT
jgi:hypothetical protein